MTTWQDEDNHNAVEEKDGARPEGQCHDDDRHGGVGVNTHSASDAMSLTMLAPPSRDSASFFVVESCTVNPVVSPAAKALPSSEKATLWTIEYPPALPTLMREGVREGLAASAMMPVALAHNVATSLLAVTHTGSRLSGDARTHCCHR